MNVAVDPEARPALVPAGNKARPVAPAARKLLSKRVEAEVEEKKRDSAVSARSLLRRHDLLLSSNLSLNASCASDASTDSFCSTASTGRIGRSGFTGRRRQSVPRSEKVAAKMDRIAHGGFLIPPSVQPEGKSRCPWVTPNSDPCYTVFHDEEWGVAVHDDKKLFELLVLSSALGELTWPAILSKRHIFREVFMNFDPVSVSKLNEKKIIAPGSSASSLLSESKLRAIIENSRQLLKIVEECGSFDSYCWSFVNHKPIISRFRYSRQVPVKTSKADMISKDLMRRGFRGVGPTVIHSFMQAAGMTNDHLVSCYRFEECSAAAASTSAAQGADEGINGDKVHKQNKKENRCEGELGIIDLELSRAVDGLSIMVLSSS